MTQAIPVLHHITAISGPPQMNVDFSAGILLQTLEVVRQRADAPIRNGEYLFKRPAPSFDVELDIFRKTK